MFEPWAPGKVDGPMDRSKSGPPTRAKMSDKTPANDEDCHSCGSWVNPQTSYLPYLSISIHIYSLHFRALEHKGLDSHPNFMEWPPKFAEWHVLQSDCLFFLPVFFPHLAIKIPWGSLKCDLCGSWCGCITAAEFARFTPFQQAAQWPWLRSERSERSECCCQGTPPLKSTWKAAA